MLSCSLSCLSAFAMCPGDHCTIWTYNDWSMAAWGEGDDDEDREGGAGMDREGISSSREGDGV